MSLQKFFISCLHNSINVPTCSDNQVLQFALTLVRPNLFFCNTISFTAKFTAEGQLPEFIKVRFPVDLLIMLDSSSSIGTENFEKAVAIITVRRYNNAFLYNYGLS